MGSGEITVCGMPLLLVNSDDRDRCVYRNHQGSSDEDYSRFGVLGAANCYPDPSHSSPQLFLEHSQAMTLLGSIRVA